MNKFMQYLAPIKFGVFNLTPKLAIGKGASAAFAKLHIGFRVQGIFTPQTPGILRAFTHCLTALEHDWLKTHLCQQQSSENTARTKANYHGTAL